VEGISDVRVGYAGGTKANPTYYSLGNHTEVVQVHYDPAKLSYDKLLSHFWKQHNYSSSRREQYQSLCLWTTEAQKKAFEESAANLKKEGKTVATKLQKLEDFYYAEEYHQNYFGKQGGGRNRY